MGWQYFLPDVRAIPVYIYGLAEPDIGTVRYVGRSRSPKGRLSNLRVDGSSEMKRWLSRLSKRGLVPEVVILETVQPGDDAAPRELIWISRFGYKNLLNVAHPGFLLTTGRPKRILRVAGLP